MITIKKGIVNSVTFTLNEKTTISSPFYFIELYSNSNKDSKLVKLVTDISINKIRWNEFVIEENDTEDLENGIVSLESGTYDYFVYQSKFADLDIDLAESIVESGKCVVPGGEKVVDTFDEKRKEYTFK